MPNDLRSNSPHITSGSVEASAYSDKLTTDKVENSARDLFR